MSKSDKLKAATSAFFTAFQNDPRLDAGASTSMHERVAILEDMAIKVAKEHGIAPKNLIDAVSGPIMALKGMMDGRRKADDAREYVTGDAFLKLGRPLPDKGYMLEFRTLKKSDITIDL